MMTSATAPSNILQRALGPYASALHPKATPLPEDRDELLFTDAIASSEQVLTATRALEHNRYTGYFDMGLRQGRRQQMTIPSYGDVHVDVRPQTRMQIALEMYNGAPSTYVEFRPPLWIADPLQFLGSQLIHTICGLSLEAVELRDDKSIWIRGHIKGLLGVINKSLVKCVKAAPDNEADDNGGHPLWNLVLGAGKAIILSVPRVIGAVINSLHVSHPPDDSFVRFWHCFYPLLEPGSMDAHGAFELPRPLAVRTNDGDFVFDSQEITHHFEAAVMPTETGIELHIGKGSELNSKTLAMHVAGVLAYDGTTISGRDIDIQVQHVQLDAFLGIGGPGSTLLPLHINSRYDGKAHPVTQLTGNFAYGDKLSINGEVNFRLPAQIHDSDRHIHTSQADLHIERANMGMVVKGHAKIGNSQAVPHLCASSDRDADVNIRVDQFDMHGALRVHGAGGVTIETPVHLLTDVTERPLELKAAYRADSLERPGEVGGVLQFALPVQIQSPGHVDLNLPRNLRIEAQGAAVRLYGRVVFGTEVCDKMHDVEARANLQITDLTGTLNAGSTQGATDLGVARIEVPGSMLLSAPSSLRAEVALEHTRNTSTWPMRGTGTFVLSAQTPKDLGLHLQVSGGPMHLLQASTEVTCQHFRFAVDGATSEFEGVVTAEHRVHECGAFTAQVVWKNDNLDLIPNPMPEAQAKDEGNHVLRE